MINEKIKIEDNFLDLAEFNKIQELMMGPSFPWFYSDKVVDYYRAPENISELLDPDISTGKVKKIALTIIREMMAVNRPNQDFQ